jgi:hypothetical protein
MNANYLNTISQFQTSQTVCNFLQVLSADTWERIKFARTRKGLRIYETTITQNLLFELRRTQEIVNAMMGRYFWNIRIYESRNEKANGNDIELFIPFKSGYLFFPTQAKIIYHQGFKGLHKMTNGDYPSINHVVKSTGQQQIDSLLSYAKRRNGYPLYLLYNYVNEQFSRASKCNVLYQEEQYGCSVISANLIYKKCFNSGHWNIPTFQDLHPKYAHPWFILACCFSNAGRVDDLAANYFPDDDDFPGSDLKIYTSEDIGQFTGWKDFDLTKVQEEEFREGDGQEQIAFVPKFRIILDLETINRKFQERRF